MSGFAELRLELPGTWQLEAYTVEDPHGAVIDRPFGEHPIGLLVYTAGGHISVHAMAAGRTRCETLRPVECAPDVKLAAYDSYVGYAGTWTLDGDVVTHHVEATCFPDWTGTDLRRIVRIEGDALVLRGAGYHPSRPRIPVLTWRRDPRSPQCTQP